MWKFYTVKSIFQFNVNYSVGRAFFLIWNSVIVNIVDAT